MYYQGDVIELRAHQLKFFQERLLHRYDQAHNLESEYGPMMEQNMQNVIRIVLNEPTTLIKITNTDGDLCSPTCRVRLESPHFCEDQQMLDHEQEEAERWGVEIGQIIEAEKLFKLPED